MRRLTRSIILVVVVMSVIVIGTLLIWVSTDKAGSVIVTGSVKVKGDGTVIFEVLNLVTRLTLLFVVICVSVEVSVLVTVSVVGNKIVCLF